MGQHYKVTMNVHCHKSVSNNKHNKQNLVGVAAVWPYAKRQGCFCFVYVSGTVLGLLMIKVFKNRHIDLTDGRRTL